MSKEDRQAIDLANSASERRERQEWERAEALRCEENTRRRTSEQKRQWRKKVLIAMIPAMVYLLTAMLVLAAMVAGWVKTGDMPFTACLNLVLGFAGGRAMAKVWR